MKIKNDLYICYTYHHVVVSVVKALLTKEKPDIVIAYDGTDKIREGLLESGLFHRIIIFSEMSVHHKLRELCQIRYVRFIIQLFYKKKVINAEINKIICHPFSDYNEIYIYNDWSTSFGHFLRWNNISHIKCEDGVDEFKYYHEVHRLIRANLRKNSSMINNLMYNIGLINSYGAHKSCKIIEINDKNGIYVPLFKKQNLNKMRVLNKKEFFDGLSAQQKEKVFRTMTYGIDFPDLTTSKYTLFCTTIMFADGLIPQEKQENIYREVLDKYAPNESILIKPHPRDSFDFRAAFKNDENIIVLDNQFPTEILRFYPNIHIEKAIGLLTSSIDMIDFADKKIKLWDEYLPKSR